MLMELVLLARMASRCTVCAAGQETAGHGQEHGVQAAARGVIAEINLPQNLHI